MIECCDLQPGKSYVNFRRDCHMTDRLAVNYTAADMTLETAAGR
jgi:hypothetical protein